MPSRVQEINSTIKEYEAKLSELRKELLVAKGNEFFVCANCNTKTKIRSVSCIKKQYYNQTNAGSGSYWSFSEYQIYCPKCEARTRMLDTAEKEFMEGHVGAFLEELEWYPSLSYGTLEFTIEGVRRSHRRNAI